MGTWAIAYDLDTKRMRDDGLNDSDRTTFYKSIRERLAANHFETFQQLSIYTSEGENSLTHAFAACQALRQLDGSDKYIKRLHLFRIDDLNDLLPVVADRPSAGRDGDEATDGINGDGVEAVPAG